MPKIILASASASRNMLLKNAGVRFTAQPAAIDERTVERPLGVSGRSAAEIAMALAEAKALAVAGTEPDALVIGADQILEANGRRYTKPQGVAEARDQLLALAGRMHELHAAIAVAHGADVVWRHAETARMVMRPLTPECVDRYLEEAGEAVLASVGAYQIEGPGIRLFERIDGDYFAILGLPLLPLLGFLREAGGMCESVSVDEGRKT